MTNNEFNSSKYSAPVPNDPEGRNQGQVLMSTYALVYSRTLQWLSVVFLAAMWLLVAFVLSPMALQHFRFDTTPGTVRRPLSASDREAIQTLLATPAPGAGTAAEPAAADRKVASAGAPGAAGGGAGTASVLPAPPASSADGSAPQGETAEEQRVDNMRDAAAASEMTRWAADVGTPSLPASGFGGPVAVEAPSAAADSGDGRIRTGRSGFTGDVGAIGIAGMVGTGCGAVRMEPPSRPDYPHAGATATAMTHVGVSTAAEAPAAAPVADHRDGVSPVHSDIASIATAPVPLGAPGVAAAPTAVTAGSALPAGEPLQPAAPGKQLTRDQSAAAELAATGRITPAVDFPRVAMAFKDIHYSVRTRSGEDKPLLRGCSGYALPYTLTALMGASGAGKTTLLDVLAFRKTTGKVSGTIQLNGSPLTRDAAAFLHFAEQEDIHLPSATVREAMQFSAALRMPHDVTPQQRDGVLQRVARLLELGPLLDRVVGSLSRSEMKRLTIAVELAALPSVIFLDEPTSFLSASSAAIVMRALRRVAATGRTVICTSES